MEPVVYKVERTSKTGSKYEVLIIEFNGYKKMVFINDAEKIVFKDLPYAERF